jgi:chromate reductase, NAD(P)H dehydrogenase (quinone)
MASVVKPAAPVWWHPKPGPGCSIRTAAAMYTWQMAQPLTILGIAGSLRKASLNRAALRAAQQLAPEGVTVEVFDIAGIPPFNQDEEANPPAAVTELKARARAADAILFATPEYNYSIPGVLKNAIDWASRPYGDSAWEGKPVAVMGASPGALGTSRAQYHLRQCFVFLNMHPVNHPEVMVGSASAKFDGQGNLTDEATRKQIAKLLDALAAWTRRLKQD